MAALRAGGAAAGEDRHTNDYNRGTLVSAASCGDLCGELCELGPMRCSSLAMRTHQAGLPSLLGLGTLAG